MTIRLYYEDSYLKEFSATVLRATGEGERPTAILDRTAFYPTSGGQPHDTGRLGSVRVLGVEEDDSSEILHILDSVLPPGPATGAVDWERRFDHMQQHTGQHILSQAFVRTAQAPTVSFHLGSQSSTIDLELPDPSANAMRKAEDLATAIVFDDRPVHVLEAESRDLTRLDLRKETQREGIIRVIDVEGFDRSPCGGTHVRRTGEIGMIAILGYERYKGGTRVEFVCGGRALRTLRNDHETLIELARLHSSHPSQLPGLTEKLLAERGELSRENARLREGLIELEARDLVRQAEQVGSISVAKGVFADRTLDSLRILARKLADHGRTVAVLGLAAETGQVVLARSEGVPGDCGAVVRKLSSARGGRGGGRPESAQAGGIPRSDLERWMEEAIREMTSTA